MTLETKKHVQLPLFDDSAPLPTGKVHISYSELFDHIECSYKHKLKHVDKIDLDGPSIHTEFGQVIHDVLESFLLTKIPPSSSTISEASIKFRELVAPLVEAGKVKPEEVEEFAGQMPAMIAAVPGWMDETFPGWEPVAAEFYLFEKIKEQTKESRYFKGFIDAVIRVPKKVRKTKKVLLSEAPVPVEYDIVILDWKGQRLSAPILTPSGWKKMGDLKIGDDLISSDGQKSKVEAIFPLGKKEVYRLTLRDDSFVDCTSDHLWKVYRAGMKAPKILTTLELIDKPAYRFLPVLSGPVEYEQPYKPGIDPYLFGVLLGDGCLTSGVKLSTADSEILENIRPLLPLGVVIKKIGASNYDYGLTVDGRGWNPRLNRNPLLNELRDLGILGKKSPEKFIPEPFFRASSENRLALVQGLMDTDGWVQKGCAKFSSTSFNLVRALKALVESLGGSTFYSIRHKKRNPSELTEHILTVRLPSALNPFRLERKKQKLNPAPSHNLNRVIKKIEKVGYDDMQCIGVSAADRLYVTNDYVLTHNTTAWGWPAERKRDFNKQLQLMLYKHFWCEKFGLDLKDVKCGFVLLKRTAKEGTSPCELVPVSVGPVTHERSIQVMNSMINMVRGNRAIKNRYSCRFCPYSGTVHCR